MNNLQTSIALSVIAKRNVAYVTDNYEQCVSLITRLLHSYDDQLSWTEIDIQKDYSLAPSKLIKQESETVAKLHNIIIWKNFENFPDDRVARNSVLHVFDQLQQFNTNKSKKGQLNAPVDFMGHTVIIPDVFLFVPIMVLGSTVPKINYQLKERFWFCQSVFVDDESYCVVPEWDWDLEECRNQLTSIYVDPEVREYTSSLMVFTRSHRLTSLAPLTSRPTLKATTGIIDLCKALTVWNYRHERDRAFVTPDYVKVAYRKVCYWLVDWETNLTFTESGSDNDFKRKMQISVLTGDWYGSEWHCVKTFLKQYASTIDEQTTTGFRNKLVDDVLESVLPPL